MSHKYRNNPKAQKEIFSNVLVDSWSYSKVSSFARNEKAFEMDYIYCNPMRRSASSVAGNAYHKALEFYFSEKKAGRNQDIVGLQMVAFNYIDDMDAYMWKLQKTTPTIEECQKKAISICTKSLENFFTDISVYESEIKEILAVELYIDEYLTINGVDIPIPCHLIIDLVILTTDNKIAVIDHKSKAAYSDEKALKFSIGKQAVTYAIGYEEKYDAVVDEVWFVENKHSKNRDGSPQLKCFKIALSEDVRKLYEALLYEPLKRMMEAISNPDYIYLINENDNFVDLAEIYEFWGRTMIAEIDDFNVPASKRDMIQERLKKIRDSSLAMVDPKAIKNFRANASEFIQYDLTNKDMSKEQKIEHTLRTLGILVSVAHKIEGYSSDTFLLEVTAGTNISSVHRYKLDIANALNVSSIRMMKDLFVYEGKSYLAVESSKKRERDLMFDASLLEGQCIPIGMSNFNEKIIWDMANPSTPHVLICGATGSGKSVLIISIIEYAKLIGMDQIVLFDPKYEFVDMASDNICVYNEIEHVEEKMESLVVEMQNLVKAGKKTKTLVVFDEFADAVAMSRKGKDLDIKEEVQVGNYAPKKMGDLVISGAPKMQLKVVDTKKSLEENLKILLQKGRSIGYRIVAATQRASVKVITGDAKVNFPVQICFRVPKEVDSVVVLGEPGAESLSGNGDGLIRSPEYENMVRFQGFYKA